MNTLSIVATPIGNLNDITLRAIEVLKSADLILCEDTRVTRKLLDRYEIKTQTLSYHMHSRLSRVEEIIKLLKSGKNLALVSDAGTPGISDPGSELVARIRKECAKEIEKDELKIASIPGPSALISAFSIAGISHGEFTFLGFLPHKKGKDTLLKEIIASERTMIFYESPHRILKTLQSLATVSITSPTTPLRDASHHAVKSRRGVSASLRDCCQADHEDIQKSMKVTVCRELTKIFEEVVSGSIDEVIKYFELNPDKVRGEFVVIVSK